MKQFLFGGFFVFLFSVANAQEQVKWNFAAVKKGNKTYEIKITGTIAGGWHVYSQTTPEGGPLPTKIEFKKNPLILWEGDINEVGQLQVKYEEEFKIHTKYYADKVEFVQLVKLKSAAKTSVTGTLEFMTCNDKQCFPPATKTFTILLN